MGLAEQRFDCNFAEDFSQVFILSLGDHAQSFVGVFGKPDLYWLKVKAHAARSVCRAPKNAASFSMWLTPGSSISRRAIFSTVRLFTPEPSAIC